MSRAQAPEQPTHPQHDTLPRIECVIWGSPVVGRTHAVARLGGDIFIESHPHTEFDEFERYRTSSVTGVTARVTWRDLRRECSGYGWFADQMARTNVLIVMFAITDRTSFEAVPDHVQMLAELAPRAPIFVVGAKCDLRTNRDVLARLAQRGECPVEDADAEEMCARLGVAYFPLSNLTGTGARAIVDEIIRLGIPPPANSAKRSSSFWSRLKQLFARSH
jgi:GTPase SAR1 family protein